LPSAAEQQALPAACNASASERHARDLEGRGRAGCVTVTVEEVLDADLGHGLVHGLKTDEFAVEPG
jgi:hypothetical protein